jgi:preprotein translocase subunit SecD
MKDRKFTVLTIIIVLVLAVVWVDLPTNPGIHLKIADWSFDRDIKVHQGLDLQGGVQVLLEVDLPPDQEIDSEALETARVIVENRVNGWAWWNRWCRRRVTGVSSSSCRALRTKN